MKRIILSVMVMAFAVAVQAGDADRTKPNRVAAPTRQDLSECQASAKLKTLHARPRRELACQGNGAAGASLQTQAKDGGQANRAAEPESGFAREQLTSPLLHDPCAPRARRDFLFGRASGRSSRDSRTSSQGSRGRSPRCGRLLATAGPGAVRAGRSAPWAGGRGAS